MSKRFNIEDVMKHVQEIREGFVLEADFQFVFGMAVKDLYKEQASVIMGYKYPDSTLLESDTRQYIDILVIMNNIWYPIELKFKHSDCEVSLFKYSNIRYKLANQSCRTTHRQDYVNDIRRLLKFRDKKSDDIHFGEGYAILLTNYINFETEPYSTYSLTANGIEELRKEKYKFEKDYDMKWIDYNSNNDIGKFVYLITTIKK